MKKIRVSLFGPPQIVRTTQHIDIGYRKSTALLVYLIATKQLYSRDTLAELFWPDVNASSALGNLRRALYRINRSIGEPILIATRKTITISPAVDLWVDIHEFESAANQGLGEHPELGIPNLEEARTYYKNDFLAGFSLPDCPAFDEWQFFQAESLRRTYANVLNQLSVYYEENHQWEKALLTQRQLLALDTLSESANRDLMSLYARTDQPAAALRQFEDLRRRLEKELKVEPEDQTYQLYEAIRSRQIVAPQTESDPNLDHKARPYPAHHLPSQPTRFIGRKQDLKQIVNLLDNSPDHHLLTVTGPGGIGKTRLAVEAAENLLSSFSDGVYFIHMGNITNPEHAFTAIAERLGLYFYDSSSIKLHVLSYLRDRNLLLVLDNFDQLIPEAALITEILELCPKVKILVTSCERMNLSSEHVHPLAGLSYPDAAKGETTQEGEAVQLLVQLAQFRQPGLDITEEDMPHITQICKLVGGMPLALVLAAGWLELLTFKEIAAEIEQNLDFLEGKYHDAPKRHHSIRAAFEYSWNRLSQDEKQVLMRISVFSNGFTRPAAQFVSEAELYALRTLIDKSLLHISSDLRYDLHQSIGFFAAEKLAETGKTDFIYDRHSKYYLHRVIQLETDIKGQRQLEALNEIEADFDNILKAWKYAVNRSDFRTIGRASECLYLFFTFRSRYSEGFELFQLAHEVLSDCESDEVLAYCNRVKARMYWFQAFYLSPDKKKTKDIQKLITFYRKQKNHPETAFCLLTLGAYHLYALHDSASALICFEQSLHIYRKLNDRFYIAVALLWMGTCHGDATNINNLLHYTRQSLELARETGNVVVIPYDLRNLSLAGLCIGNYSEAEAYCQEALVLDTKMRFQMGIADATTQLGLLNFLRGNQERAQALTQEGLKLAKEVNFSSLIVEGQAVLSLIASMSGNHEEGRLLAEKCLSQPATHFGTILSKWAVATSECISGHFETAEKYLWEAIHQAENLSYHAVVIWLLPEASLIKLHKKQVYRAAQLYKLGVNHTLALYGWASHWDEFSRLTKEFVHFPYGDSTGEIKAAGLPDIKKLLSLLA
jgi:predicted ATPase/DNA-binding SARP family transcriptional activator